MRTRQSDAERKARKALYKSKHWRNVLRANQLRKRPKCEFCGQRATDVDHIIDHNMDMRLFNNPRNLRSLCHPCHSRRTRGAPVKGCDTNGSPLDPDHPWNREGEGG